MKFGFKFSKIVRQMWFLPAVFSLVAIATASAARYSAFLLPEELPLEVSQNAIETILTIVATSMLTVATFALATMVSAFFGAAQGTTPRAVRLIAEDRAAQAPISIFIGSFLFSIVGIIALSSGFYSASGRLILFGATILVVGLLVGALIRWINKIPSIGQVGETIKRMETATSGAFDEIARRPLLGCLKTTAAAEKGVPLHASRIGYVQHVQPDELQSIAEECDLLIHISARPGVYVTAIRPLVLVDGVVTDAVAEKIRAAFILGRDRTFDHDPRFGLIVLGEIASRALSPGINDPGTAINVIQTHVRILTDWFNGEADANHDCEHDRVSIVPILPEQILHDAFRAIARDGADNVEVCLKLFEALEAIHAVAPCRFDAPIAHFAEDALERVRGAMSHQRDLRVVEAAAEWLHGRRGLHDPEP
ncbi:DUF2254 domain-containing protein [Fulvimarina sp. 2208YS6-2-32]|uniref:DUF2254 domain-containing protein n=1 Tax=Fulvimarina uroteuthidis TaxID=3098149 RepID=A0ABU5I5D6_9HYPH|nr:DUF2254 domain-containing protein [Fulvimarina sp. 2208YS6-2-32]MDY8110133.1 DUF2254 domain-containing protein [Fulvimarina sp. 2208YS6-2-32]